MKCVGGAGASFLQAQMMSPCQFCTEWTWSMVCMLQYRHVQRKKVNYVNETNLGLMKFHGWEIAMFRVHKCLFRLKQASHAHQLTSWAFPFSFGGNMINRRVNWKLLDRKFSRLKFNWRRKLWQLSTNCVHECLACLSGVCINARTNPSIYSFRSRSHISHARSGW